MAILGHVAPVTKKLLVEQKYVWGQSIGIQSKQEWEYFSIIDLEHETIEICAWNHRDLKHETHV